VTAVRTFPPGVTSIRAARRFVLESVGTVPALPRAAIEVMVSELAMNTIQHANTAFEVRVALAGPVLRVEVTDSGSGRLEVRAMPPPGSTQGGRGLSLVEHLSDRWGVRPARSGPGKTVWFEISVRDAGPAPSRAS
jgi:anti-sigma regulatory factor (Ser/Thr protein kinase)